MLFPFAILTVAVTLTSCRKAYHEDTELYIFVANNITLPYWQEAKAGFMDAARGLGVKVEFVGPDSYSPEAQLEAFRSAVARKPAGILVSPARPDLFTSAINEAIKDGIPVICVDSDAPESRRILFIGTDNYQAGRDSAELMAEILSNEGRIVLITVPGQLNLEERLRGVNDVLKKYPKMKITRTLNDKGDPRLANDQVSALLEAKEQIDGILCLEASGGPGAAEALHRLNLAGTIAIVAMDKNPETLDWIERGTISATVAQKPYTMSFYGLRFLDDLHHNAVYEFKDWRTAPASPLPSQVSTGTAIVVQSNLGEFRAALATRRTPL